MLFNTVVKLIESQYPTYHPWAEACALWTIANAAPEARLPGGGNGLPITFNTWSIGPSRFGFKTLPAKLAVEIVKECGVKFLQPRSSVEWLINHIYTEHITSAALFRDELSGLTAEARKQYMAGELAWLCQALDGTVDSRGTFAHDLSEEMEIRLNFIATCTPDIYNNIEESFWNQGLGNRLVAINWMPDKLASTATPFMPNEDLYSSLHEKAVEEFNKIQAANVKRVKYASDNTGSNVYVMTLVEEQQRRIVAFDGYWKDKFNILNSYKYEANVFIKKIAALRSIDRAVEADLTPQVYMEDYRWATKWMGDRVSEFEQMYDDWKECRLRNRPQSASMNAEQLVLNCIVKKGGSASESTLNNSLSSKIDAIARAKALQSLLADGKITQKWMRTATRPVSVYTVCQ